MNPENILKVTGTKTLVIDLVNPLNNEVWIEGSGTGVNRNGKTYTTTITQKLIFKRSCREQSAFFPSSGIKEILVEEVGIVVDFGEGTCDNTVTVIVNCIATQHTLALCS